MPRDTQASQTFIMLSMGLVAIALSVAMYQHGGLPAPVAATAALSTYVLLLTLHAIVWRRSKNISAETTKDRRENQLRRIKDEAKVSAAPQTIQMAAQPMPAAPARAPAPHTMAPPAPTQAENRQVAVAASGLEEAAMEALAMRAAIASAAAGMDSLDTEHDAATEAWDYRPAAQTSLPPFVTSRAPTRPKPSEDGAPEAQAARPPQSSREADVEHIQDAIKRLLEEVNAAERKASAPRETPAEADRAANEAAIEQSLDALRYTGSAMMRATTSDHYEMAQAPPAPKAAATWQPQSPQVTSPSQARARLLSDAITAGRIDVTLEPILGLEDQKTRHYEVAVRLRDANGKTLDVLGDGPDLRGTGLLPLFDSVSVTRVAAVARRLDERGKGGSIFSRFSGESIADDQFVGELAETLHQRSTLATQLVLSFSQADVRHFATPEWDALADMRALGFRFAISSITDLDMDFEVLAEQGFAFAKLDASVFLRGLPAAGGNIPSSDVCRHLAMLGLTLVIEHIESEDQLARIFGFGVLLGQGQLFGGPRPVRADAVATTAAA